MSDYKTCKETIIIDSRLIEKNGQETYKDLKRKCQNITYAY